MKIDHEIARRFNEIGLPSSIIQRMKTDTALRTGITKFLAGEVVMVWKRLTGELTFVARKK